MQVLAQEFERPEVRANELGRELSKLRRSRYLTTHVPADEPFVAALLRTDVRVVTIMRDPRAVVVSAVNYLLSAKRLGSFREQLMARYTKKEDLFRAMVYGEGEPNDRLYRPELATILARYTA